MDPVEVCGAQDWYRDDDGRVGVYGTCQLPAGHTKAECEHCGGPIPGRRFHQEIRDGKVWAEWSGPSDERAPIELPKSDENGNSICSLCGGPTEGASYCGECWSKGGD
jgi:hypothetical protein